MAYHSPRTLHNIQADQQAVVGTARPRGEDFGSRIGSPWVAQAGPITRAPISYRIFVKRDRIESGRLRLHFIT